MRSYKYSNVSISNHAIIITALSCLFGLVVVIGAAILWSGLVSARSKPTRGSFLEESEPTTELAIFQEGYSIMLPTGFTRDSREQSGSGTVVYRYRSEQGFRFTFAIVSDQSIERFSQPPKEFNKTLVKSVPELNQAIEGHVQPERVTVDGMSATLFRFYEKETFRGVTFIYVMVAIERGKKLVLKMTGRYGGYHEDDENIEWPDHWYDSLVTLRHARP